MGKSQSALQRSEAGVLQAKATACAKSLRCKRPYRFEEQKAGQGEADQVGRDQIVKGLEGHRKEFRFYPRCSGKHLKNF